LIIIIALGESIVAIGVGVSQLPVSWPIIVASVLGIAVCATLWWAYFDVVAIVAEDVLHRAPDNVKPRLARDSYTFLHLPMIAGIILMALGQKKVFAHLGEHLPVEAIAVLYGGVSLYLWAHVAFRLRNIRTVNVQRTVVATLLLVLIPVCATISALSALAVLTVIMVGLIAYEARHFAELRYRIRHGETSARP
jgi:low temperature requirement protein LtrA